MQGTVHQSKVQQLRHMHLLRLELLVKTSHSLVGPAVRSCHSLSTPQLKYRNQSYKAIQVIEHIVPDLSAQSSLLFPCKA